MSNLEQFNEVKKLVEKGIPVYKALKKLKIRSNSFYNAITEAQKIELQTIKTSLARYGVRPAKRK